MRYALAVVLIGGALLLWLLLGTPAGADSQAGHAGACTVKQAARDLRAAERALERAKAKASAARYVLSATRKYSSAYGSDVGRWTRLALDVGWSRGELGTLMPIVWRESRGDPDAKNPVSTASGLLQFLAMHWDGTGDYGWRFDPFDARANLSYGHRLYLVMGWSPWAW